MVMIKKTIKNSIKENLILLFFNVFNAGIDKLKQINMLFGKEKLLK